MGLALYFNQLAFRKPVLNHLAIVPVSFQGRKHKILFFFS